MQNPPTITDQNQLLLPLPAGVRFTSRRLEMPEGLTPAELLGVGLFLNNSSASLDFWRADYIAHCRKHIGDEATKELLRQLEFENADFKRAQLLASIDVRDADLSPEHHFVLARAKLDDVARDMWVTQSKENNLSAPELQESIKKGTVTRITPDAGSGAGGVTTWGGIRMQFDLIRRRIGAEWKTWPLADCDSVLKDLASIMQFAGEISWRRRELLKDAQTPEIQKAA